MDELLVELAEPLLVAGYAVLAAALALAGVVLEYLAVAGAAGGGLPRLWVVLMGAVVATFGVLVARDKLLPAVRATS